MGQTTVPLRIPERHKHSGIRYFATSDGIELPFIDLTNPAFQANPSDAELAQITRRTLDGFQRGSRWPAFVVRLMAKRSLVMRNTLRASGSFLPGMATYIQKLPSELVGSGWGHAMDRKLLRSIGPVSMRLRLRHTAELAAAAIQARLSLGDGRPIHLLGIAGGTGIDLLNALLVLARDHPDVLSSRTVAIHLLDPDADSAAFGARCLDGLKAADAPLAGLDISLAHQPYDWRQPDALVDILESAAAERALVVCTSEGGLFEYGSDADVTGNLETLRTHAPADTVVIGSVLLDGPVGQALMQYGRMAIVLRKADAFESLVGASRWQVARTRTEAGIYLVALLARLG